MRSAGYYDVERREAKAIKRGTEEIKTRIVPSLSFPRNDVAKPIANIREPKIARAGLASVEKII